MRFFLVALIWVVIVGGLWGYISNRDARRQQAAPVASIDLSVSGNFAIEITPTFSTEQDPFALTTSQTETQPVDISLNGSPLVLPTEELIRGEMIRLESVPGVLAGHNEIYLSASPPLSESNLEQGVRIKVYEDSTLLADDTVWAEQGALVSGTVSFSLKRQEGDDHGH